MKYFIIDDTRALYFDNLPSDTTGGRLQVNNVNDNV